MKIRGSEREKVEIRLHMTPMIDVVFLLLVFFVLTYKQTVREGDFSVRMPLAAASVDLTSPLEQPMTVQLTADNNRNLAAIDVTFGTRSQRITRDPANPEAMFEQLRSFVISVVTAPADPGTASEIEAEIDAAYQLRYAETIKVIESLSGYRTEDRQIVQLLERIKFRDVRQ